MGRFVPPDRIVHPWNSVNQKPEVARVGTAGEVKKRKGRRYQAKQAAKLVSNNVRGLKRIGKPDSVMAGKAATAIIHLVP